MLQGAKVTSFPGSPEGQREVAREGTREHWRDGGKETGQGRPMTPGPSPSLGEERLGPRSPVLQQLC